MDSETRRPSSTAGKRLRRCDAPLAKGTACGACRARKVRCDAGVPACRSCVKMWRGLDDASLPAVVCDYGPMQPSVADTTRWVSGDSGSSVSPPPPQPVPIKYKWKTFVPVQLRQSTALPPRGTATSPLPRPRQTTASNPPYHTRSPRPARSPPRFKSAASEYVDRTPSYYPDDLPSAIPFLPTPSRPIYAPYPTARLYPVASPPSPLPYTFPPAHSRRQTVPQSVELGYPVMGATSAFERLLLARPGFSNPSLESAIYAPLRFEASRTPARVAKQDLVPAGQGFYGGWLDAGPVEIGSTESELYPDRGYVYL